MWAASNLWMQRRLRIPGWSEEQGSVWERRSFWELGGEMFGYLLKPWQEYIGEIGTRNIEVVRTQLRQVDCF